MRTKDMKLPKHMRRKKLSRAQMPSNMMTSSAKEEYIFRLENERLEVVREIEAVMKKAAKISGDRFYKDRRAPVGRASNDYRPMK